MFLESITAQGFNGVSSTLSRKFECQENVNKTITKLEDPTLITAFSIIFDSTFGSIELAQLVDIQSANPFVEVVLWQSETLAEFKWLKSNRLILHRNLREKPDKITVNGKVMDIRTFHQGMASHGYISIENFHLHRLLNREVLKMEHFTGDDLWNLILKMNDCGELVQIIETRHRNRKMLNKELAKMMKTMEDVLPSKLKLRKDIKSHIQLVRQFNSLMSIVNRRKTKLLIRNKEALLPEVASLMNEQNETATALHDAKIKEASSESLKSHHRKQQRMMLSKKMEVHAVIYDSSADLSEPLAQVYQSFSASITSVMEILEEVHRVFINVEDFAESTFSKSHAQLVAVQLQLMLNSMQKEGNQEKMRNLLNFMLTSADKNLQAFKTEIDELTKEIEKSRAVALKPLDISEEYYRKSLEELNSSVFNLRNMITKVGMEIYTNEKLVEDFQFDIEDLALKGKVDMKFVKTLQAIEGFVLSLDARLSADYLGPVFQHLKSVPELDDKIWPLIASKAQIFLFIRGSTARMVNKMMIESGVNQGPFVFMGLDEFVANNLTAVEDELKDQVKSASLLVKSDVRFAKILKKLLGEVILLENNAILSQIPSDRIVVTFSEAGITSKSNGYLTITSVPYKLTDMQDYSTIDFLQNIYANVTQQVAVLKKIEVARASQLELEAFLKVEIEQAESIGLKDCMAVNKAVVALHELYQLLRGRSEVQMMFHKEEALSLELKGFKNKEPWDENEMIDARTALEEKFTADEDRLIRLQNELRRTDMKFDGVMHNIGISQIKLTGIFTRLVVADSFNKEAKKINDNILAQLEKELKAVYKFLRKKSSPPSDDTEMRLKLHEVGYQLYKKNSQMSVINSAFRLCQATDSVIDQSLYDEFKRQSGEAIAVELAEIRQGLQQHAHSVQLEPINLEQYGHLFETIKKVKNYSESPPRMMTRSKVTAKAFPLGNQLIVQILKDVVYNFEISFNYLLTEFNQRSTLYFYTVGMFEAIKKDDLSWDSFDMRRLKAMDFSTDWKGEKISSTSLKRIKGLLLILHIISSMSIFKFVIIEEKFFDNMEETLKKNIRKFLETISTFVQVILFKIPPETEVMEWESAEQTM